MDQTPSVAESSADYYLKAPKSPNKGECLGACFGRVGFATELVFSVLNELVIPEDFTMTMRHVTRFGTTCRKARRLTCDPRFIAYIFDRCSPKGSGIPPRLFTAYALRAGPYLNKLILPNALPGWSDLVLDKLFAKCPGVNIVDTRGTGIGSVSLVARLKEASLAQNVRLLILDGAEVVCSSWHEEHQLSDGKNEKPAFADQELVAACKSNQSVVDVFKTAQQVTALGATWHTIPPVTVDAMGVPTSNFPRIVTLLETYLGRGVWTCVREWPSLYNNLGGDDVLISLIRSTSCSSLRRLTLPSHLSAQGYRELKQWAGLKKLECLHLSVDSQEEQIGPMNGAQRCSAVANLFTGPPLPKLTELSLPALTCDDDVLKAVALACPNLEKLSLFGNHALSVGCFAEIFKEGKLSKVREWVIHDCPNLAGGLILLLASSSTHAKNLRVLKVVDSGNLAESISEMATKRGNAVFPRCTVLTLGAANLKEKGDLLALSAHMPNVASLNLSGNPFSDDALQSLTSFGKLRELVLKKCPNIGVEGYSALKQVIEARDDFDSSVTGQEEFVPCKNPADVLRGLAGETGVDSKSAQNRVISLMLASGH